MDSVGVMPIPALMNTTGILRSSSGGGSYLREVCSRGWKSDEARSSFYSIVHLEI